MENSQYSLEGTVMLYIKSVSETMIFKEDIQRSAIQLLILLLDWDRLAEYCVFRKKWLVPYSITFSEVISNVTSSAFAKGYYKK